MKNLPVLIRIVIVILIGSCAQTKIEDNTSMPMESSAKNAVMSPTPVEAANKSVADATNEFAAAVRIPTFRT